MTIDHDSLDLIVQSPISSGPPPPQSRHQTLDPKPWLHPMLGTPGHHHWRFFQTCSLEEPLPLVLTSGCYQSMYSWQASGMHPPGMLSCYPIFSVVGMTIFCRLTT